MLHPPAITPAEEGVEQAKIKAKRSVFIEGVHFIKFAEDLYLGVREVKGGVIRYTLAETTKRTLTIK